jgi:hypothetical protein
MNTRCRHEACVSMKSHLSKTELYDTTCCSLAYGALLPLHQEFPCALSLVSPQGAYKSFVMIKNAPLMLIGQYSFAWYLIGS